jgi:7-cyano-7-deazaguanine reductase
MADPSLLETFPNPHPDRHYLIEHSAHEFTSLCPVTAQPDYGTILIRYVAGKSCIELRSLKQYFQSFRDDGIYYEDVTNRILDDLAACCDPHWIEITSCWSVRGGIQSTITASRGDPSVVPATPARNKPK